MWILTNTANYAGIGPIMVPLVLGGIGLLVAFRLRFCVLGTTLLDPWRWMLAALIAVSVVEALACTSALASISSWRLAAGCATFCPLMSLLGAKRPQNRGWHFVVLALWIVLILPLLEASLLRPGQAPDMRGLRAGFMLLLIALGLFNAVPTRGWPAAIWLALAQLQLLREVLPVRLPRLADGPYSGSWGLLFLVISLATATWVGRRPRTAKQPLDRVWLDFRDGYGLLWALRVAERVNAAAAMYGWDFRLRWNGFRRAGGADLASSLPPETEQALQQNMENLLRRFVSDDWIARRLSPRVH